MANGVRKPTQIPTLVSCFSYPEQRHLVPPEWGSGLLTEVIAPQRDPRLQLQLQAKKWEGGILTEVIEPQLDPPTSSNPAAALFHKLRLFPLLPGSGGILDLFHELINVQTIGLESLASGFHI